MSYIQTPGDILLHEFMEPLGISEEQLAKAIRKRVSVVHDVITDKVIIGSDISLLLSKALGTTPEFWVNLQATYFVQTCAMYQLDEVPCLVPDEIKKPGNTPYITDEQLKEADDDTETKQVIKLRFTGFKE